MQDSNKDGLTTRIAENADLTLRPNFKNWFLANLHLTWRKSDVYFLELQVETKKSSKFKFSDLLYSPSLV